MYYETNGYAPIYGIRTNEIDGVFIDENYTKAKKGLKGLPLPKEAKYYTKVAYSFGEIGYKWIKVKDCGDNSTEEERKVRYVKASYRRLDGTFGDLWPFAPQMKREEIENIIKSYGFKTEIPNLILNVYNGVDQTLKKVEQIVDEIKRVMPLLEESENANMCLTLRLSKD